MNILRKYARLKMQLLFAYLPASKKKKHIFIRNSFLFTCQRPKTMLPNGGRTDETSVLFFARSDVAVECGRRKTNETVHEAHWSSYDMSAVGVFEV